MHAELEQLLVLQDRQQQIKQIQNEIETVPLQRTNLEGQLTTSAAAVEALRQKARQIEMDRKKMELDVGTRTESIARLKTQQYQTRKNDEFQAIGHEIERYENEVRRLEDEELEIMLQADKLKAELEAAEKSARATKESISRQLSDLETKSKALESRREELAKERDELAAKMIKQLEDEEFNNKPVNLLSTLQLAFEAEVLLRQVRQ